MEQSDLQKLLLKTAVCTVACDGEIHEKEIAEMNSMVSQAVCFRDFNGGELLQLMLDAVSNEGRQFLRFGQIPLISDDDMQIYKETDYEGDINKISKNYDEIKLKAEEVVISEKVYSPNIDLKENPEK
jgi:hypothetical protein